MNTNYPEKRNLLRQFIRSKIMTQYGQWIFAGLALFSCSLGMYFLETGTW